MLSIMHSWIQDSMQCCLLHILISVVGLIHTETLLTVYNKQTSEVLYAKSMVASLKCRQYLDLCVESIKG